MSIRNEAEMVGPILGQSFNDLLCPQHLKLSRMQKVLHGAANPEILARTGIL